MKRTLLYLVLFIAFSITIKAQNLIWTPSNGDGVSFFQIANWIDESTGVAPVSGVLGNGVEMNRNIHILNSESVCGGTSGIGGEIVIGDGTFLLNNSTLLMSKSGAYGITFNISNSFNLNGGICHTEYISGADIEMDNNSKIYFYSNTPLRNGANINIVSESWEISFYALSIDEIRNSYLSNIKINGLDAVEGENIAIWFNGSGTVITPTTVIMETPLTLYSEYAFQGDELTLINGLYDGVLGDFEDKTVSFKLDEGYMATFAQDVLGRGVSKVYIASDGPLEINLPAELQKSISFVRVSPWLGIAKKRGFCGKTNAVVDAMNSSWFYDWGSSDIGSDSREYVVMNWSGNDLTNIQKWGADMNLNHQLAFNEPDGEDQANMTVDAAIIKYENLQASGLRLGSPAVTDGAKGKAWRDEFMDKADAAGYRIDYIAVHYYKRTTATNFYNWLKDIYDTYQLPIWITEFNYGSTWADNTNKTLNDILIGQTDYIEMLDTTSFIERYSIFTWQPSQSDVMSLMETTSPVVLNANGEYYSTHESPKSYEQEEYEEGRNDDTSNGVDNSLLNDMDIYPNPVTNGCFTIQLPDGFLMQQAEVSIFDSSGVKVFSIKTSQQTIDINTLNKGFYLIEVIVGAEKYLQKLIIQ